jgi:DivIVA domain-containing protein
MTMISDRPGLESGGLTGRLTPDTVRRLEFPRTPLGRRGFHEADVERFRNKVVLEIVTANAEKAELRQEIQRLRDYYRRQGDDGRTVRRSAAPEDDEEPATPAPDPGPTVDAVNVMSRAQQAADQHIAQAEEYARRLISNARSQYEDLLNRAHDEAEQAAAQVAALTEQRRRLEDDPLTGPVDLPATDDGATPAPAGDAPSGTSARSDPALDPETAQHLMQLESRLAYMRTFAQVTQVQLRSILDALGEELDHLTVPTPPVP